jgi:hypothetical protein
MDDDDLLAELEALEEEVGGRDSPTLTLTTDH